MILLLYAFLIVIGISWPALPFGATVADLVFVLLAIVVLAKPRLRWHRSDLAIALYLLGALPAVAISGDRRGSAIELVRELYVAIIFIVTAIAAQRGFASTIGRGLALGGAILSIAGVTFIAVQFGAGTPWPPMGEVMQLPYIGDTLRLRALATSEAMLACVLTVSAPFAITMCSDRTRGWCAAAAAMLLAAAFTFSHAIAGLAVAVLISAWPSFRAWPRLRRLAVAGVALIVLALNFAATASIKAVSFGGSSSYADASQYHYAVDQRMINIGNGSVVYNVMSYARIKQVAWHAFAGHPIAGIGLDQFHTATRRAFEEGRLTSVYREIDPHSTVLGRFAETGLIGGATLLFLWFVWARMAADISGTGPIGLAASAAFAGLIVSSVNADIMNFRFLWVVAGLMRGLQEANGMAIASGRETGATTGTD